MQSSVPLRGERLFALLDRLPARPGVYLMKGAGGRVIYVGKAKSLRARVRSYFRASGDTRPFVSWLDELLTDRTRLVAVTAVSNMLGTINPIEEIVACAHAMGALVLVDAAQSVPHLTTDVQKLGCDFLAFSGHKMLGHSGIGVLYGRRELLDAMPPFIGGGSMINEVEIDSFTPAALPAKFEAGTPAIVPAIAMAEAIKYLENVGLDAIHEHEQFLTRHCHDVLDGIAGVRIFGPGLDQKAGIVSFTVDGIHAHDIAAILDRHGVAVRAGHHCTQPLHTRLGVTATTRASFYLYNTLAEVDLFGEAIVAAKAKLRSGSRRRRKRS